MITDTPVGSTTSRLPGRLPWAVHPGIQRLALRFQGEARPLVDLGGRREWRGARGRGKPSQRVCMFARSPLVFGPEAWPEGREGLPAAH